MRKLLIACVLISSFASAMQMPLTRTSHSDSEDYEELPQELLALWKRFHEVKGYYTHVFGVVIDKGDLALVQLRLKSLKTEVDALALAVEHKAMKEDQKAYVLGSLKKLQTKLYYFPL